MELSKEIAGLSFEEIRQKFTSTPYNLKINESKLHPTLYNILYHHYRSDFNQPVVSECRGIIVEKGTHRIVCYPFSKFWNFSESRAAPIDWSTAAVQEKYDGCIIKLYHYEGEWLVATNGTVDAREAPIGKRVDNSLRITHHLELFEECWRATAQLDTSTPLPFDQLDTDYTYMFEAMHPFMESIVKHQTPQLRHIGTRNMRTMKEVSHLSVPGIHKAEVFPLHTLAECKAYNEKRSDPFTFEGFVIVDSAFNRVKLKSVAFISLHHVSKGLLDPDGSRMLAILTGEDSEVNAYFPGDKAELDDLKEAFIRVVQHTAHIQNEIDAVRLTHAGGDRKAAKKAVVLTAKAKSVDSLQFTWLMTIEKQRESPSSSSFSTSITEEIFRDLLSKQYSVSPNAALELARFVRKIDKLIDEAKDKGH